MGYKFLDKVYEQILSETRINNDRVYTPFSPYFFPSRRFNSLSPLFSNFLNHCIGVYSLNDHEIKYVWDKYKNIIKDKIDEQRISK
jgi:hypothetical protein